MYPVAIPEMPASLANMGMMIAVFQPYLVGFVRMIFEGFGKSLPTRNIPQINALCGVVIVCGIAQMNGVPITQDVILTGLMGGAGATGLHKAVQNAGRKA